MKDTLKIITLRVKACFSLISKPMKVSLKIIISMEMEN